MVGTKHRGAVSHSRTGAAYLGYFGGSAESKSADAGSLRRRRWSSAPWQHAGSDRAALGAADSGSRVGVDPRRQTYDVLGWRWRAEYIAGFHYAPSDRPGIIPN